MGLRALLASLLALGLLALPDGAWASPLAQLLEDGEALAASPLHWDAGGWGWFGFSAAGTAGLYQADARVRAFFQDRRGNLGDHAADVGNALGDGLLVLPALGLTAAWAHHAGNGRMWVTSGRAVEAVLFSGGGVAVAKMATGRARPSAGLGPHDWSGPRTGPDGRLSFPSGHSATAFSVATVLARSYPDGAVPYVAYGAAVLTGYARLESDDHWASDVWAGAAAGIWIGRTLTREAAAAPRKGPEAELAPLPGGALLRLTWSR